MALRERVLVALYLPLFVLGWLMGQTGSTRAAFVESATSTGNTFSTAASFDTTAPTIVSHYPANQQNSVSRSVNVQLVFSEDMNDSSVWNNADSTGAFCLFQLLSTCAAGKVAGTGSWSSDGNTFTFNPTSNLTSNVKYRVTIGTGAQDLAGNALAAAYGFTFQTTTTTDAGVPQISSRFPTSTNTATSTSILIVFNEQMDRSATEAAFCLSTAAACGGTQLGGALSWASGDTVLSFKPSATLSNSTNYNVRVCDSTDSGCTIARDTQGNLLSSTNADFSFTTAASSAGTLLITSPVDGAHVSGTVTITGTANGLSGSNRYDLGWTTNVAQCVTNSIVNAGAGLTNGTLGTSTLGATDGFKYLCLRDDGATTFETKMLVVLDNTVPTVSAIAPLATNKASKKAGESLTVDFSYTETNPSSYTIRVCSDGSSDTNCNNTKIGEKTFSGSLAGGTAVPITDSLTLSSSAVNGNYDLRITVTDRAGNVGADREIGAVVIQSAGSLAVTADNVNLAPTQSTTIRATVLDGAGSPLNSQTVNFTKDNACAGSSLSPASDNTGVNGEYTTTLTVCSTFFTTLTVTASTTVSGTTLTGSVTLHDPPLAPPPDDFSVTAGSIKLAWRPAPDPRVAGYRISLGTSSGKYKWSYDAGDVTSYTIEDVSPGATYYLVLESYDKKGHFSKPTREASLTLPAATATPTPMPTATATPTASPTPTSKPKATPTPKPAAPLRAGSYEEDNDAIEYTGSWKTQTERQASGGKQRLSHDDDATAEVVFEGRSVTLVFSCGPDLGRMRVFLNGRLAETIDQQSRSGCWQQRLGLDAGSTGTHALRLEVDDDRPVTLDAIIVSDQRPAAVPTATPTATGPQTPTPTPKATYTPTPGRTAAPTATKTPESKAKGSKDGN